MFGFSAISASPISAIRVVVVDAVSLSESAGFSATLPVIGVNNVRRSESIDGSATFNGGLTQTVFVQEAVDVDSNDDVRGDYSGIILAGTYLYEFMRTTVESNSTVSEELSMDGTESAGFSVNLTVQESATMQDAPNGRLLWEPDDNSQTPDWQVINTG
jgi:hypothetical protein